MPRLVYLVMLALCGGLAAQDLGLVRVADVWRWQPALQNSVPIADGWQDVGFADGAWPAGPAGFTVLAYGREATVVSAGPVCLRRTFHVDNPASVVWLVLRADWSGGFVAYLNGAEIARRNLDGAPGQPVPFDAVPSAHASGAAEELDCTAGIPVLRAGENVLAIQWHPPPGVSGTSLVPELLANFTRGPFVQCTTPTSQVVAWRTPVLASTEVEFGETDALGQRFTDPAAVTNHAAILTGLQPDRTYCYRLRSSDGTREAVSPVLGFRTLKTAGPLRFVVTADTGGGARAQFGVAAAMRAATPDLVLLAGDTVYPRFSDALADQRFFSVYRQQMTGTPFFLVGGNHDVVYSPPGPFFDAFYLPTNSVPLVDHALAGTGPEYYYSFDHGDAHFTGLYVPLYYTWLEFREGSPQWRWLDADLAASAKPWKFIFLHLPLMSSGPHATDDYNFNGLRDSDELAAVLLPLARRHGVQMIFSGHDHGYERFHPVDGVQCVVSGGGGGALYPAATPAPESAQFQSRWHCLQVDVTGDALHLQALDANGARFDELFLQRVPPGPRVYQTAWHTPLLEPDTLPDGDGNLTGQRFDFVGEPIPTATGEFSNLGRVWVNQDHDHLYVGFEQVEIPRDGNVFLFVENPALAGVGTLAGLGNGVVDPAGEGADGLDFLENLAFKEFKPNIACVLGDEFADGQFRSFLRTNILAHPLGPPTVTTNLALDIGQGVFRLDATFSDVAGARSQQFNRSPQSGTAPNEQNADLIGVAIPLAALGLHSGETVKLGAVVGGGTFATNAEAQTRWLDSSYLGASLDGSGMGSVVLEGISVQLGPDLDPDGDGLTTDDELTFGTNPEKADTDGDGLPDGWELAHSLSPLRTEGRDGAQGNPDGDGLDNAAEFATGTDPQNPASVFRLTARRLPDGQTEFQWPAVPGRRYQFEWAADANGVFLALEGPGLPREATHHLEALVLTAADVGGDARFYRLRLLP